MDRPVLANSVFDHPVYVDGLRDVRFQDVRPTSRSRKLRPQGTEAFSDARDLAFGQSKGDNLVASPSKFDGDGLPEAECAAGDDDDAHDG